MLFILNSILLGIGLGVDAFSVSVATSIVEWDMRRSRMCLIAGTFGLFQLVMPLVGWALVHGASGRFDRLEHLVPYIALILLCFIGGRMILEEMRTKGQEQESDAGSLVGRELFGAGVATSIDALSVGFTNASLGPAYAVAEAGIIGGTTFILCMTGLMLGTRLGNRVSGRAQILGGAILIVIGIEIFVKGVFFS